MPRRSSARESQHPRTRSDHLRSRIAQDRPQRPVSVRQRPEVQALLRKTRIVPNRASAGAFSAPGLRTRRSQELADVKFVPLSNRFKAELGPSGTGKSHRFQQVSTYAHLVSGGKATVACMFVNNANGQRGLVSQYDVVYLHEVSGFYFYQKDRLEHHEGLQGVRSVQPREGKHPVICECSQGVSPSCGTATMHRAPQGGRWLARGVSALECRATCESKVMTITGENPSPMMMWKQREPEDDCAVARRGGKQPEGSSQTQRRRGTGVEPGTAGGRRRACVGKAKPGPMGPARWPESTSECQPRIPRTC